jgi:glycosyltransferase involved in cell wall biosynthesis
MKVLFVVPAPLSAVSGGYGYDRRIIAGLRDLGHEVEVAEMAGRHPHADEAATAAARGVLDRAAADQRLVIDGLGLPAFAPFTDELERRGAVGLIHHPTALEHGNPGPVRDALRATEQAMFPRLARIIAPSEPMARRLPEEFGVDPARLGVVEPGTDRAERAAGSTAGGCAILSVGALIPRKGHDVLLRALATLPDLQWHLTVAGGARDGTYATGLGALAEELGIAQRVTLAGEVGPELEALWQQTDLFALATYWEGYGMAVAEALARGIPLALTAGGAVAELAPKAATVLVQPGDHAALGRAMRRPIFDAALRAEMAEAAWQAGQRLPGWDTRAAAFADELARA